MEQRCTASARMQKWETSNAGAFLPGIKWLEPFPEKRHGNFLNFDVKVVNGK